MNFDASDIIKILRIFKKATNDNQPRQVERIEKSKPSDNSVRISFAFLRRRYIVYIDNHAEDDETYIQNMAADSEGATTYVLVENPTNEAFTTYGLPFKGKDVYLLAEEITDTRLDIALAERYGEYSRSVYQKMIANGQIKVNGTVELLPKFKVSLTDTIEIIETMAPQAAAPVANVIYEDEHVLVINKPVGMLTHAKGVLSEEFTAADFIKDKTAYKHDTNRPGIVHRLDRATSGVLLMVKTDEAAKKISQQFSDRKTKKVYKAIVSGVPKQPTAMIDLPIGRNPSAPSTFRVDAKGKPAQTLYEVEESTKKHSLVRLQPTTGRTHQLRVHMSYIGCPIVGDIVYGSDKASRMYLHAESLEVTLPGGKRVTFTADLPDDFVSYMETAA